MPGEVEDAADALWRYVRSEGGRDAPRVLAVEGRGGAGLDERVVHFDQDQGRLSLGEGNRRDAQERRNEERVLAVLKESGRISGTELLDQAGGNRNAMLAARSRLANRGQITGAKQGNTTYWSAVSR